MTLQECYAAAGGNYDEVMQHLRSEKMVQKFVLKFLNDKSYTLLCDSLQAENYEEAFRAAHTLKGICQNLSLTLLGQSSSKLTEELRQGQTPNLSTLFQQVKSDYEQTAQAIRALE